MKRRVLCVLGLAAVTLIARASRAEESAGEVFVELQQADGIPAYANGDSFVDVIVTSPYSSRGGTLTIVYDPQDVPGLPEADIGVDFRYPNGSGTLYVIGSDCPDQEGKRTFRMDWVSGSEGNYLPAGRKNPAIIKFYRMLSDTCTALSFREDCLNLIYLADGTSVVPVLKGGEACYMSRTSAQLPGDCDGSRQLDIGDAICVFGFLFDGGPTELPCSDGTVTGAGNLPLLDFNGDQGLDIADGIGLLQYLFLGGPPHSMGTRCRLLDGCATVCWGD